MKLSFLKLTILLARSAYCLCSFGAESENFFLRVSTEDGFIQAYPDGDFHVTPKNQNEEIEIQLKAKPDWRLIQPANGKLKLSADQVGAYRVMSVLGEDIATGTVHQCAFNCSVVTNHVAAPQIRVSQDLLE